MIPSFSSFLVESEKQIFFTFGRMNPPTIGHEKLLDVISKKAGSHPYRIYLSQSSDADKNPLKYDSKIKHARKMFPKHARSIIHDKKIRTVFDILVALYDEGYKNINMVVGEDRLREFDVLINKYNGVKGRHGLYKFENINVISAGQRDPDAEGAEGMSASKLRGFAKDGDYSSFAQGLPKAVNTSDARKLYNEIRTNMGLSEEKHFAKHIQLDPVSEKREQYVNGEIFLPGETVLIKESEEVGRVKFRGSNYVIVETADKKQIRKWIDDLEKLTIDEEVIKESLNEATYPKMKDKAELSKKSWGDNKNEDIYKKMFDAIESSSTLLNGDLDPDQLETYSGKTVWEIEQIKREKESK